MYLRVWEALVGNQIVIELFDLVNFTDNVKFQDRYSLIARTDVGFAHSVSHVKLKFGSVLQSDCHVY